MVTAYHAEPKTGAIWALFTQEEWRLLLLLVYRGVDPENLNAQEVKRLIAGMELVHESFAHEKLKEE